MRKKSILRLFLLIVFSISLYSCVHDEIASSTNPSSKEYTNKSLWKQDEKYIKNVMKVYDEHEAEIKKVGGTPYWDYASTMETYDESYVAVPIVDGDKVVSVLQVPRDGTNIHFYYTNFRNQIDFFQKLLFSKYKKVLPSETTSPTSKLKVCTTQFFSVWMPNSENNPDPSSGAGHWEAISFIKCVQNMDHCVGIVNAQGQCEIGGGGGGYPYPGGGNEPQDPEEPKDPCAKTKSMLNKPNVLPGINNIKAQALQTLSNMNAGEIGFKEKKDGTLAPADVNSAHQVVFNDVTDSYGGYHNHTATGTHMFSPPDIDALFGFASAQSIQDGVGNAYLGMIAAEWCNCPPSNQQYVHYVIQYTGTGTELGGYVYTAAQMNQFIKDYQKKVDKLLKDPLYSTNNGAKLNEVGLEKLFLDTLKNIGIDGKVNLQRVENNGIVKNITENSNGTISANPCP